MIHDGVEREGPAQVEVILCRSAPGPGHPRPSPSPGRRQRTLRSATSLSRPRRAPNPGPGRRQRTPRSATSPSGPRVELLQRQISAQGELLIRRRGPAIDVELVQCQESRPVPSQGEGELLLVRRREGQERVKAFQRHLRSSSRSSAPPSRRPWS